MTNAESIEREAARWLAKRDSERWSPSDQLALDEWLRASTANRVAWLRLQAAWERAADLRSLSGQGEVTPPHPHARDEQGLARPSEPAANEATFRRWIRRAGAPLAAVAVVVLSVVIGIHEWSPRAPVQQAYEVRRGDPAEIALSDGSNLLVAGDSRLGVTYTQAERLLTLDSGEVFLSVQPDASRPFVVQAKGRRVVVVGTRFSVRLDGNRLRVVVLQGKVRVESPGARSLAPQHLTAGDVAFAGEAGVEVQAQSVQSAEELLSWRRGLLVLRDTPLSEAVAEFNRFNDHQLKVVDPSIASMPIGGQFKLSNPDAFVRLLEQGFGIGASRAGNETLLKASRG